MAGAAAPSKPQEVIEELKKLPDMTPGKRMSALEGLAKSHIFNPEVPIEEQDILAIRQHVENALLIPQLGDIARNRITALLSTLEAKLKKPEEEKVVLFGVEGVLDLNSDKTAKESLDRWEQAIWAAAEIKRADIKTLRDTKEGLEKEPEKGINNQAVVDQLASLIDLAEQRFDEIAYEQMIKVLGEDDFLRNIFLEQDAVAQIEKLQKDGYDISDKKDLRKRVYSVLQENYEYEGREKAVLMLAVLKGLHVDADALLGLKAALQEKFPKKEVTPPAPPAPPEKTDAQKLQETIEDNLDLHVIRDALKALQEKNPQLLPGYETLSVEQIGDALRTTFNVTTPPETIADLATLDYVLDLWPEIADILKRHLDEEAAQRPPSVQQPAPQPPAPPEQPPAPPKPPEPKAPQPKAVPQPPPPAPKPAPSAPPPVEAAAPAPKNAKEAVKAYRSLEKSADFEQIVNIIQALKKSLKDANDREKIDLSKSREKYLGTNEADRLRDIQDAVRHSEQPFLKAVFAEKGRLEREHLFEILFGSRKIPPTSEEAQKMVAETLKTIKDIIEQAKQGPGTAPSAPAAAKPVAPEKAEAAKEAKLVYPDSVPDNLRPEIDKLEVKDRQVLITAFEWAGANAEHRAILAKVQEDLTPLVTMLKGNLHQGTLKKAVGDIKKTLTEDMVRKLKLEDGKDNMERFYLGKLRPEAVKLFAILSLEEGAHPNLREVQQEIMELLESLDLVWLPNIKAGNKPKRLEEIKTAIATKAEWIEEFEKNIYPKLPEEAREKYDKYAGAVPPPPQAPVTPASQPARTGPPTPPPPEEEEEEEDEEGEEEAGKDAIPAGTFAGAGGVAGGAPEAGEAEEEETEETEEPDEAETAAEGLDISKALKEIVKTRISAEGQKLYKPDEDPVSAAIVSLLSARIQSEKDMENLSHFLYDPQSLMKKVNKELKKEPKEDLLIKEESEKEKVQDLTEAIRDKQTEKNTSRNMTTEERKRINGEITKLKKDLDDARKYLKQIALALEFKKGGKIYKSPRELLGMINFYFMRKDIESEGQDPEAMQYDTKELRGRVDDQIHRQIDRMEGEVHNVIGLLKPTLKATLKTLAKDEIIGRYAKTDKLVRLADETVDVDTWVRALGEGNPETHYGKNGLVPRMIAYLKLAVREGNSTYLNVLSQGYARDLLKRMEDALSKHVAEKLDEKGLTGAAYVTEYLRLMEQLHVDEKNTEKNLLKYAMWKRYGKQAATVALTGGLYYLVPGLASLLLYGGPAGALAAIPQGIKHKYKEKIPPWGQRALNRVSAGMGIGGLGTTALWSGLGLSFGTAFYVGIPVAIAGSFVPEIWRKIRGKK